jgi:hypothetical protein
LPGQINKQAALFRQKTPKKLSRSHYIQAMEDCPPRAPDILPDLLRPDLDLVICGTAAGAISAARGAYYANPGNRFWSVLAETGLTPHRFRPEEFPRLTALGIGLTDVCKSASGQDDALPREGFDRARLAMAIRRVGVSGPSDRTNCLWRPAAATRSGADTRSATDHGFAVDLGARLPCLGRRTVAGDGGRCAIMAARRGVLEKLMPKAIPGGRTETPV